MEISRDRLNDIIIKKFKDNVTTYRYSYFTQRGIYLLTGYRRRLNSAMTKDLIKEEMMCRVYSFRPNELSKIKLLNYALKTDSIFEVSCNKYLKDFFDDLFLRVMKDTPTAKILKK